VRRCVEILIALAFRSLTRIDHNIFGGATLPRAIAADRIDAGQNRRLPEIVRGGEKN
jgi:hypothetical protein